MILLLVAAGLRCELCGHQDDIASELHTAGGETDLRGMAVSAMPWSFYICCAAAVNQRLSFYAPPERNKQIPMGIL